MKVKLNLKIEYDPMKHDVMDWLMKCPVLSDKGKEVPEVKVFIDNKEIDISK